MTHTPLAGERLRPLGHVSERGSSDLDLPPQPLMRWIAAPTELQHFLTLIQAELSLYETKLSLTVLTLPVKKRGCLRDISIILVNHKKNRWVECQYET